MKQAPTLLLVASSFLYKSMIIQDDPPHTPKIVGGRLRSEIAHCDVQGSFFFLPQVQQTCKEGPNRLKKKNKTTGKDWKEKRESALQRNCFTVDGRPGN